MLITMKEMLDVAQKNKFAVPAFNAGTGQLLTAMMESAEEKQAPVIMAIHPDELSFLRDSFISSVIYEANHSKVPMVLHLDHGATYEQCIHAIQLGFTSVMIDGSHLPFEENIALTKKVVDVALSVGVNFISFCMICSGILRVTVFTQGACAHLRSRCILFVTACTPPSFNAL